MLPCDSCHTPLYFLPISSVHVLRLTLNMCRAKLNTITEHVRLPAANDKYANVQLFIVAKVDIHSIEIRNI